MGNKVKIWDVRKPTSVRLKLVLNHGELRAFRGPESAAAEQV